MSLRFVLDPPPVLQARYLFKNGVGNYMQAIGSEGGDGPALPMTLSEVKAQNVCVGSTWDVDWI